MLKFKLFYKRIYYIIIQDTIYNLVIDAKSKNSWWQSIFIYNNLIGLLLYIFRNSLN